MAINSKVTTPLERTRSYTKSRLYLSIEFAAWLCGIALLGAYAGERAWSARASSESLDAMRAARAAVQLTANQTSTTNHTADALPSRQPDTTLWSPKRIEDYRRTLQDHVLPEAVLRIPKLKLEVPVYEGTSDLALNRGAGRIEDTAPLDSAHGNIGLAAHRDGFFRPLKDVVVGDVLFIDTVSDTREYRVTRVHVVEPSDVSVLDSTSTATITLVTCYPFYHVGSAPLRLIVRAEQQTRVSSSHD